MALSVLSENKTGVVIIRQDYMLSSTLLGLEGSKELFEIAENVEPGDPENREGNAAKLYFQKYWAV